MKSIDNILEFIDKKNLSNRRFERESGLASGTLNEYRRRQSDISNKNIQKIWKRYEKELTEQGFGLVDLTAFGKEGYSIVNLKSFGHEDAFMTQSEDAEVIKPAEKPDDKILAALVDALKEQSETSQIHARASEKYAEGFSVLSKILERIENNMARADALADTAKNVQRVLGGLEAVADKQSESTDEMLGLLKKIEAQKKAVS